jgi:hypothetical protein
MYWGGCVWIIAMHSCPYINQFKELNLIQKIRCGKEFILWAKERGIPIKKYPAYGKRLLKIYENCWERSI